MAFASAITDKTVFGNKRVHYGTYTNGGADTGGNIDTGLEVCEGLILAPTGSAVGANASKVNETFPVAGSAVTIVTDADEDGQWFAWGN